MWLLYIITVDSLLYLHNNMFARVCLHIVANLVICIVFLFSDCFLIHHTHALINLYSVTVYGYLCLVFISLFIPSTKHILKCCQTIINTWTASSTEMSLYNLESKNRQSQTLMFYVYSWQQLIWTCLYQPKTIGLVLSIYSLFKKTFQITCTW